MHIAVRNPLRFGMSLLVHGSYIYVDFFFILNGFFLARHIYRRADGGLKGTALYIAHKLQRTYPFIFLSVAAMIPLSVMDKYTHSKIAYIMAFCVMQGHTDGIEIINFYLWYYSVMLFTDFIFHRLLSSKREFTETVSAIIVFIGYMYLFNKTRTLDVHMIAWIGGLHLGVLRGFAGTALGIALWKIHTGYFSKLGNTMRSIACAVSLLSAFLVIIETNCKFQTLWDFTCLPLFCATIEGAWIGGQSIRMGALPRLFDALTFPMYCMQIAVSTYCTMLDIRKWWYVPINMIVCLLFARLIRAAATVCSFIQHTSTTYNWQT